MSSNVVWVAHCDKYLWKFTYFAEACFDISILAVKYASKHYKFLDTLNLLSTPNILPGKEGVLLYLLSWSYLILNIFKIVLPAYTLALS